MDFETMRRLRESDPAKFTDIGRSKNKGGVVTDLGAALPHISVPAVVQ